MADCTLRALSLFLFEDHNNRQKTSDFGLLTPPVPMLRKRPNGSSESGSSELVCIMRISLKTSQLGLLTQNEPSTKRSSWALDGLMDGGGAEARVMTSDIVHSSPLPGFLSKGFIPFR